jgi:hypothetical protein
MDMDSLALGLDEKVVRFGIALLFHCTVESHSQSYYIIKVHQFFAHTLPLVSLILLHNLAISVHLHLLGFYSSLVIPITTCRH